MMRALPRNVGLLVSAWVLAAVPAHPVRGQSAPARDDIVSQLSQFDTAPDLDIAALKQQVLERSRSRARNEPPPEKRPPIAPDLLKLPTFSVAITFDTDTPVVRPESYQTVGRIADAMVQASLLPYSFLIVGHMETTGRRENNVLLSQRRADTIRDALVNTFKISSKRIQSLGLGEEQFVDPAHPASAVNEQIQIVTIAKQPEQSEQPAAASPSPPAKKPTKKR
jgi:outer membrane protein OmpA-like peptidoglycan-associated protein